MKKYLNNGHVRAYVKFKDGGVQFLHRGQSIEAEEKDVERIHPAVIVLDVGPKPKRVTKNKS